MCSAGCLVSRVLIHTVSFVGFRNPVECPTVKVRSHAVLLFLRGKRLTVTVTALFFVLFCFCRMVRFL